MPTTTAERHESTDLEQRDVRALTEYMTTLPLWGDVYSVTTESGSEYRVDAFEGRCTCPDHDYREVRCKHIRRVAFATGNRPIPAWVDADEVDAQLGQHVEETPKVAATDGGVTLDSFGADDRPEDCDCAELSGDFPCWPCVRDGRRDLPGEGE
ncbi:SWIM zinc finger protein [Haloarcula quadrata]|uniref:SWIM zinc finger protein n=1 Tax=Haloarcula quadrata TaxID=182779 RepID=A0A495R2S3_9EURY|nr:SWIM zinc finger family protein [Haloarcula quadrata]RKS81529.1 SWIM zinc finger protein [Haloarcula quadrata]